MATDISEDLINFPALLYSAFWPMDQEKRLHWAARTEHIQLIFAFSDYPPSCILEIQEGTFHIKLVKITEPASKWSWKYFQTTYPKLNGGLWGEFSPIVNSLKGIGPILKALLQKRIQIHGINAFLRILKILQYKGPFSTQNTEEFSQ